MNNPIIKIQNLSASYDGRQVLHDINLTIYEKDFLGIIGPNGGGKTTLLKCILRLMKTDGGSIEYRDTNTNKWLNAPKIPIGYLPQYNSVDRRFPLSVEETVLSGLASRKGLIVRYTKEDHEKALATIERMGLNGLERRSIGELSGGQLQRCLLGRAIISNPEVVILDEPATYIDRRSEAGLYELLTQINQTSAIILVSHDIGTILQQVKSVACVNKTLHYHPDTEVSTEWLEENFNCPIELLGHGTLPHRVLKQHDS